MNALGFNQTKVLQLTLWVLAASCLFLSYTLALHQAPWATFYNEWLFALALGLGLACVLWHTPSANRVVLAAPWPWWLGTAAVVAHTAWMGLHVPMWSTTLWIFGLFSLLGWLAYSLGRNISQQGWLSAVLNVLVCAALFSATIAVLQWGGVLSTLEGMEAYIRSTEAGGRVSSNIGQANNLGTLLVMGCWAIAYAWQLQARAGWWRLLAVCAWGLLALGMHASGSRTAFLNVALAPVLLYGWARFRHQPFAWQVAVPLLWWGVWFGVLPYAADILGWALPEARAMVADNNRQRLWLMALAAVAEQPWLGYGFGGMANVHLHWVPVYGAIDYTIAGSAHNIVLDMWVTFGVVLGSAIVGFFVWLWVGAWRACQTAAEQFVWLMATAMIVHAMLEYPLHYGFFFWLLCLLLGALGGKSWKTITFKRPLLASTVWLTMFGAAAFFVWRPYVDVETMYTLYRQQGASAAHQALHAQRDSWGARLYPELHARLYWLTIPMDEVSRLTAQQLTDLENETRYYPLPTLGWRVAYAHAYQGNAAQATWWAERMCKMFDPQLCRSVQQEWLQMVGSVPGWPILPWGHWVTGLQDGRDIKQRTDK